jgi:large subunit ribosomal protein L3
MLHGLLGRKVGMTQVFTEKGEVIPVTVINAGPCVVTQVRTRDNDGYEAVQLGFEQVPARKLTRPQQGHLKGAGMLVRILREFSADNVQEHQAGEVINAERRPEGRCLGQL